MHDGNLVDERSLLRMIFAMMSLAVVIVTQSGDCRWIPTERKSNRRRHDLSIDGSSNGRWLVRCVEEAGTLVSRILDKGWKSL